MPAVKGISAAVVSTFILAGAASACPFSKQDVVAETPAAESTLTQTAEATETATTAAPSTATEVATARQTEEAQPKAN